MGPIAALVFGAALLAPVAAAGGAPGEAPAADAVPPGAPAFDHSHAAWTAILRRHVASGSVRYGELASESRPALDAYLATLESVSAEAYESWTDDQRLAFWINVYNAYTVQLVLDNYPLESIRDIGVIPQSAFRKEFIPLERLLEEKVSLNHVENEVIRKWFREPRIHFAIVCASGGCPALRGKAYRATDLESQLDNATRGFVNDETKNRVENGHLALSQIFKWFAEDFERDGSTVVSFLRRHAAPELAAAIGAAGDGEIRWLDYSWALNGS